MHTHVNFTPDQLRYLKLLALRYPTVQSAGAQIIKLKTILNLPKCTEHFMSDIHGEHEAFLHILNSGSGETKEKLEALYGEVLDSQQISDLATLIYYPAAKLALVADTTADMDAWYNETIHRLVAFCHYVSAKHTQNKIRSYIPAGYEQVIDELLNLCSETDFKHDQYENII